MPRDTVGEEEEEEEAGSAQREYGQPRKINNNNPSAALLHKAAVVPTAQGKQRHNANAESANLPNDNITNNWC